MGSAISWQIFSYQSTSQLGPHSAVWRANTSDLHESEGLSLYHQVNLQTSLIGQLQPRATETKGFSTTKFPED